MAISGFISRLSFGLGLALVVAVFSIPHCEAQNIPGIVQQALLCFNNLTIYKNCEEQYRLTASGTMNVPPTAVDVFCSGPCLAETDLLLSCIDQILSNFKFYNGATTKNVKSTITTACGSGIGRGNFNVQTTASSPAPASTNHGGNIFRPQSCVLGSWAIGSLIFVAMAR